MGQGNSRYWLRALRRAWQDSLSLFGLRSGLPIFLSVVSFAVALAGLRWVLGREEQLRDEIAWGLSVLGAGGLLFIGVFMSQLALAPVRLDRERQKETDELRTHLRRGAALSARAHIVIDHEYGLMGDGVAAYVIVRVIKADDGTVVRNARGRLVSVGPITDRPAAIASSPKLQFPSGYLQWSSRYGGREVASFATECDLDVVAFENNDDSGTFIYDNEALRNKQKLLLSVCPWEISVEVFAESGERLPYSFRISKGRKKIFAHASPRGTLYEPELEEISP